MLQEPKRNRTVPEGTFVLTNLTPYQNPKQEWLLAFQNKIQTHERFKRTLKYVQNTTCIIIDKQAVFYPNN